MIGSESSVLVDNELYDELNLRYDLQVNLEI